MVVLRNLSAMFSLFYFLCASLMFTSFVHADIDLVEPQPVTAQVTFPSSDVLDSIAEKR